MTVDDDNSAGDGVRLLVPETKANDDDADLLVNEMNKISADDLAEKESHSIEIDLMQDTIRKQLLKDQYRDLWCEDHGYQSPSSDQKDTVDDKTDNVDKVDEDTEDKEDTETDDFDEDEDVDVEVKADEDESFVPEDEPDDDDEGDDYAVCDHEENPDDVGEDKAGEGVKEIKVKKVKAFEIKWVHNNNNLMSFYNTNGNCRNPHRFVTVEGYSLVNWVHDQRKKFKRGKLTDDRINLLSDLQFEFSTQPNVVGAKVTVTVAISKIFKYKKENGNSFIPNKEPYKQLHCWIYHAKNASKKIVQEGNGNSNFTLLNLKLFNELGTIKLPTNFKLKETATPKAAKKKDMKKKMTRVPPKAKAQGALATLSRVSVIPPRKKITASRPKAKAPIQQKNKMNTMLKSPKLPSQPTCNSPRRAATAIDTPPQEGTSFHSLHNNPFSKLTSPPADSFPIGVEPWNQSF
jgi:hypothetical protein